MARAISLLLAAAVSANAASADSEPRSAKADAKLQRELGGKVVTGTLTCLPRTHSNDMVVIDDNTILFRNGRSMVYRNDPRGGCSPIGSGFYTLKTRSIGTGTMCSGDIAEVVSSGMTLGSCTLGDFVRYESPKHVGSADR